MSDSITSKIDELLSSDATFSTRSGVRFLTEVIRDAYKYIEKIETRDEADRATQNSIVTRLTNVENGLNDFLILRAKEQEKNEAERSKWRWAIITPTLGVIVIEIARWVLGH